MANELDINDFIFMTVEEATDPPAGLVTVLKDYWWPVDEQGRIAFFNPWNRRRSNRRTMRGYGSPQCNANKKIAERVAQTYAWATECQQIPAVFVKEDPHDWA